MDGSIADSLLSSYDRERIFSFRAAALPVDDAETLCVRVVRLKFSVRFYPTTATAGFRVMPRSHRTTRRDSLVGSGGVNWL